MTSEVQISKIVVSGLNPRKHFDPDELKELQASIEQYGILEPLIVRSVNSHYELVAGERRLRAATAAGLKKVPVVVRALTDPEVHEIMLIENLQRSQLAPLEEAQSIQVLLQDGIITQEDLARRLGKSQAWVANRLRLLAAPEELKDLLISREITPKHVLAALPYAEYPIMKEITAQLQKKIQERGSCSVVDLQKITDSIIKNTYQNEHVLDIDHFSYDNRAYEPYFDSAKCQECKHIVLLKDYDETDHRYCLQRKCWKDQLVKAKNKFDAERAKALENQKSAAVVDTSEMDWNEYQYISTAGFDTSVCHSCGNCKQNTSGSLVCVDPKCYKKHKTAYTKEKNKVARTELDKVWSAVDKWIDQADDSDEVLTFVLRTLIECSWSDPTKKGLSRWCKIKTDDQNSITEFFNTINKDELWPAILRLLVAQNFERALNPVNHRYLEQYLPAAAAFVE